MVDIVEADNTASAAPVIGGSVADGSEARVREPNTSAGRAAALRGHRRPAPRRGTAYEPARRRWRGPALVLGLLLLAAGGLFGGTWWYSQHQYYVGTDGTNVIVYKGIDGTVLGIHYSSAIENTGIRVSSLPQFERERVIDTIGASSRRDADRIVGQLQVTPTQPALPQPSLSAPASPAASSPVSSPSPAATS